MKVKIINERSIEELETKINKLDLDIISCNISVHSLENVMHYDGSIANTWVEYIATIIYRDTKVYKNKKDIYENFLGIKSKEEPSLLSKLRDNEILSCTCPKGFSCGLCVESVFGDPTSKKKYKHNNKIWNI